MAIYSETLDLDANSLTDLGEVYFGYAQILIKSENKNYYPQIASCYVLSAVLKSIASPGSGTDSFKRASSYYKREGNDYWVICSACAYDTKTISDFLYNKNEFGQWRPDILEWILTRALTSDGLFREFYISDERLFYQYNITTPIGRLRIPAKLYFDALQDILNLRTSKIRSFGHIIDYLNWVGETIFLSQENSSHWQSLLGDIVPIEPEVLAFCMVICKTLNDYSVTIDDVFGKNELNPIAKVPLQIANEIYNSEQSKL
jgi:hypothetical protein